MIIFVPEELDHHGAEKIRREADQLMGSRRVKQVIFDFRETVFMDSAGIGMIMGRYKLMQSLGFTRIPHRQPGRCMEGTDMGYENEMKIEFDSRSCNEGFIRVAVSAFMTQLNPTLEEVADVKTAVSEAVTNCIVHAYDGKVEKITVSCHIEGNALCLSVKDTGCGIPDIEKAMEPLFTTRPEMERSGMGFAFMEAFMDEVHVESTPGHGTTVSMRKEIGWNKPLH